MNRNIIESVFPHDGQGPEFLEDFNSAGKPRPWALHHRGTMVMSELYELMALDPDAPRAAVYLNRSSALAKCATYTIFEDVGKRKLSSGRTVKDLRLRSANFCRVRLCPMCQWRRSLKLGGQARQVVSHLEAQGKKIRWLFLTVTVKNVPAESLGDTVTHLHQSLTRMTHRQTWPAVGWLRATEVTYNNKTKTYHPHMHLLLAVEPSYFGKDYMSQADWVQLWKSCARLDYDPVIDIRAVKPESGSIGKAIAEVSKYAAKPTDYIRPTDLDLGMEVVKTLDLFLDGRRLTSWGGILKTAATEIGLDDLDDTENGDLVHIDEGDEAESTTAKDIATYISYTWSVGWGDYIKSVQYEDWAPALKKMDRKKEAIELSTTSASLWLDELNAAHDYRIASLEAGIPLRRLLSEKAESEPKRKDNENGDKV